MNKKKKQRADTRKLEERRTLIAQILAEGIYSPKLILAELLKRGIDISRTQLWRDMQAIDVEEEEDFRAQRTRVRWIAFKRYLRRERDAERSIADIQADEQENFAMKAEYKKRVEAARASGLPMPEKPKYHEINYSAKATMLRVSMEATEKYSAMAGVASSLVGVDDDLASLAATLRTEGEDAFERRAQQLLSDHASEARPNNGKRKS